MPKPSTDSLGEDGANVRKSSNHLQCQTAPIRPRDRPTGFFARISRRGAGRIFTPDWIQPFQRVTVSVVAGAIEWDRMIRSGLRPSLSRVCLMRLDEKSFWASVTRLTVKGLNALNVLSGLNLQLGPMGSNPLFVMASIASGDDRNLTTACAAAECLEL
jgi:hypothetical protein